MAPFKNLTIGGHEHYRVFCIKSRMMLILLRSFFDLIRKYHVKLIRQLLTPRTILHEDDL